jgi:hypothetical protein
VAAEAGPPAGDGIGITVEFLGNEEVGGPVGLGAAEDEACAKREALGSQARVGDLVEAFAFGLREGDPSCFASHARASVLGEERNHGDSPHGSPGTADRQEANCTRMFTINPKTCETLA